MRQFVLPPIAVEFTSSPLLAFADEIGEGPQFNQPSHLRRAAQWFGMGQSRAFINHESVGSSAPIPEVRGIPTKLPG